MFRFLYNNIVYVWNSVYPYDFFLQIHRPCIEWTFVTLWTGVNTSKQCNCFRFRTGCLYVTKKAVSAIVIWTASMMYYQTKQHGIKTRKIRQRIQNITKYNKINCLEDKPDSSASVQMLSYQCNDGIHVVQ